MIVVDHPFPSDDDITPLAHFYARGDLQRIERFPLPPFLARGNKQSMNFYYLMKVLDFVSTIFVLLRAREKIDVFVGVESVHSLAGLFLRSLGMVKHLVYYAFDYWPDRFSSPVPNIVFLLLDRFCVRHADAVWNLDAAFETARLKLWKHRLAPRQLVVPILSPSPRKQDFIPRTGKKIVYLGGLEESFGVQAVLRAMPSILKDVPEAELHVIGKGPFERRLRNISDELNLSSRVSFHGFLPDSDVETIFRQSRVGVAPYMSSGRHPPYQFFFPSKVKYYAAFGVPSVVSSLVSNAQVTMKQYHAGLAVSPDPESLASAISKLLLDEEFYRLCLEGCFQLSEAFNSDRLLEAAFTDSFPF